MRDQRAITRVSGRRYRWPALPRQRFHDLRHAAATFMLSHGGLAEGGADGARALTGCHVVPELQRDAAERVGAPLSAES